MTAMAHGTPTSPSYVGFRRLDFLRGVEACLVLRLVDPGWIHSSYKEAAKKYGKAQAVIQGGPNTPYINKE